jgi:hypothetical protein
MTTHRHLTSRGPLAALLSVVVCAALSGFTAGLIVAIAF